LESNVVQMLNTRKNAVHNLSAQVSFHKIHLIQNPLILCEKLIVEYLYAPFILKGFETLGPLILINLSFLFITLTK